MCWRLCAAAASKKTKDKSNQLEDRKIEKMQHRFTNAPSYGLDFSNSLDPWKDMKQLWTEAAADKIAPVTGPSTRTLYVTPFTCHS